jgi:hypothetical protein
MCDVEIQGTLVDSMGPETKKFAMREPVSYAIPYP